MLAPFLYLTQLTSAELAFVQNLVGLSYSTGDILYYDGNDLVNLGIGTSGQVLKASAGGIPEWGASTGTALTVKEADGSPEVSNVNTIVFPNASVTDNTGGEVEITFPAGAGLTVLAATGTIDDSNTDFDFASKPVIIFINGTGYLEGGGWSWSNPTATLSNPVGTGGAIFGIS